MFFFATQSFAATRSGKAYAFYIENDSRFIGGPGSDQAYSNGLKFAYIFAEDHLPRWSSDFSDAFSFINKAALNSKANYGISVGHQLYTPNDTVSKILLNSDRPYASWLYLGFAMSLQSEFSEQFVEFDIGMIGPSALGKNIQNGFHNLIHEPEADGWNNGLHDEPTLQIFYQRRNIFQKEQYWDIIPFYGASFGNVKIGTHAGGVFRVGTHLPDNFGSSRPSSNDGDSFISPTKASQNKIKSYYLFSGLRGNLLARNIFLDGNSLEPSHHVKKYPFTFESEFGFGYENETLGFVWRFVTQSPEFEERSVFYSFASLNLVYFL
jgi:hypothetical protein